MTATIGFLSVRVHPEHGYFGGYLLVNHLARPLEFHCTLPVKPSRAQTLLYGPTIDDFVCGEQIAKALIAKAKITPDLVIADSLAALAVTLVSDIAVVQLDAELPSSDASEKLRLPNSASAPRTRFNASGHAFVAPDEAKVTQASVQHVLEKLSTNFDLTEPFQRIMEALLEAHPIVKAA